MKVETRKKAIILLLILIAIGGVVMYGGSPAPRGETLVIPPQAIKGPTTPPPGYVAPR